MLLTQYSFNFIHLISYLKNNLFLFKNAFVFKRIKVFIHFDFSSQFWPHSNARMIASDHMPTIELDNCVPCWEKVSWGMRWPHMKQFSYNQAWIWCKSKNLFFNELHVKKKILVKSMPTECVTRTYKKQETTKIMFMGIDMTENMNPQ